jgi:hypothetical protein
MPGKDIQNIRKFVGAVTKEQLRYVDCFVGDNPARGIAVSRPGEYLRQPRSVYRLVEEQGVLARRGIHRLRRRRQEAGEFRAVIDREYSLEAIADAYRFVETG